MADVHEDNDLFGVDMSMLSDEIQIGDPTEHNATLGSWPPGFRNPLGLVGGEAALRFPPPGEAPVPQGLQAFPPFPPGPAQPNFPLPYGLAPEAPRHQGHSPSIPQSLLQGTWTIQQCLDEVFGVFPDISRKHVTSVHGRLSTRFVDERLCQVRSPFDHLTLVRVTYIKPVN